MSHDHRQSPEVFEDIDDQDDHDLAMFMAMGTVVGLVVGALLLRNIAFGLIFGSMGGLLLYLVLKAMREE